MIGLHFEAIYICYYRADIRYPYTLKIARVTCTGRLARSAYIVPMCVMDMLVVVMLFGKILVDQAHQKDQHHRADCADHNTAQQAIIPVGCTRQA